MSGGISRGEVQKPAQESMVGAEHAMEMSNAAYRTLTENNLICDKYLVEDISTLNTIQGEWDATKSCCLRCVTAPTCSCCCTLNIFTVRAGHVRVGTHSDGRYLFFGQGIHVRNTMYYSVGNFDIGLVSGAITNGTKALVTVTQGLVGLAFDQGQPVVLPPGLHQWDSTTLKFESIIDLSSNLIKIGPYTLVTVDQGYAAITQDNGKQVILDGGKAYMLTHQNWKFVSFLSMKMQVDSLSTAVTTGDNIGLTIKANVTWQIEDARLAAARSVENSSAKTGEDQEGLKTVRTDVIRQVISSLAYMVGGIQFGTRGQAGLVDRTAHGGASDIGGAVGFIGESVGVVVAEPEPEETKIGRKALFDPGKLHTCADHANAICSRYGVNILTINLIEATPTDATLLQVISSAAIASATAEQSARMAQGEANVVLIQSRVQAARAEAEAEAMMVKVRADAEAVKISATAAAEAEKIRAEADSAAERMRGQGARDAGKMMEQSEAAVAMAKLKIAYKNFDTSSTYYFGLNGPCDLGAAVLGKALADQSAAGGAGSSKKGLFG